MGTFCQDCRPFVFLLFFFFFAKSSGTRKKKKPWQTDWNTKDMNLAEFIFTVKVLVSRTLLFIFCLFSIIFFLCTFLSTFSSHFFFSKFVFNVDSSETELTYIVIGAAKMESEKRVRSMVVSLPNGRWRLLRKLARNTTIHYKLLKPFDFN